MRYFKQSALTADEIKKNERIALQYAHWIAAKIQKDCSIRESDPRSFDLNVIFPIEIKKFLVAIADKHHILLPHLLGETEEVFLKNTQEENSFVQLLAEQIKQKLAIDQKIKDWADKELSAMAAALRKQDHAEDEKLSQEALQGEVYSAAHELQNQGYIAANSLGYPMDIWLALQDYADRRGSVHVIAEVTALYSDIKVLQNNIEQVVKEQKEPQILMGVTQNGAGHYVVYAMQIHPTDKTVTLRVVDSKNDSQDPIERVRKQQNEHILKNMRQAVTSLGYQVSSAEIRYTAEQGADHNCPYFAVRTIIKNCYQLAPTVFDGKSELARAAEENDIDVFKLAMLRKSVARFCPKEINADDIHIDELGIVYYDATNAAYLKHKSTRQAIEQDDNAQQIPSLAKRVEAIVSQLISTTLGNEPKNLFADLEKLAEESDATVSEARMPAVKVDTEQKEKERSPYHALKNATLFGRLSILSDSVDAIKKAMTAQDRQIAIDEVYARFLQNQELIDYYENPSTCRPFKK
ncbi:MAG: hypothetical protein ACD_45C00254G0018 [uncultured bacterium]|nr:MAG: hypothetical protein ACD_45C00254G0018 [uncultured bacterium]